MRNLPLGRRASVEYPMNDFVFAAAITTAIALVNLTALLG